LGEEEVRVSEIRETAITWDHDTHKVMVSTRSRRIAQRLRKIGAEEGPESSGYWNFTAGDDLLRISLNKRRKGRPENLPRRDR